MTLTTTIGGAASDSYATYAEWTAYADGQGWGYSAFTQAQIEAAMRRATLSIDVTYDFIGYTQYQTQALQWPRVWTGLVNGWPIDPDSVPTKVKTAQNELAWAILGGSDPVPVVTGAVMREKAVAGPVETETEYAGGVTVPRFVVVDRLLAPYCNAGAGQVRVVRG